MAKPKLGRGDVELGRRVRAQRLAVGMSQQELAGKLGISFQQVQKYEKGSNRISILRMRQIAKYLKVPISYFVPEDSSSDPPSAQFAAEFIGSARAVRLFRAFSAMTTNQQAAFVNLAEQITSSPEN